jgi:PAS domain S-box-containing protein
MIDTDVLTIMADSDDGVYAVDMNQKIIFWNKSAERILGYSPEEMLGKYCHVVFTRSSPVISEETGAACQENCITIKMAQNAEVNKATSLLIQTKDGTRKWITVTHVLFPATNSRLATLLHIFHDVTADKKAVNLMEQVTNMLHTNIAEPNDAAIAEPNDAANYWNNAKNDNFNNLENINGGNPDPLTSRELDVLKLLTKGMGTQEIAEDLVITNNTARNHIQRIIAKMGVHSRLEAVALAYQIGLI